MANSSPSSSDVVNSRSENQSSRYPVDQCDPQPDPNLLCPICQDVLDDPLVTACKHIFCKVCLKNVMKTPRLNHQCPVCREGMHNHSFTKPLPAFMNMINGVKMKCVNFESGCKDLIRLETYLRHSKTCGYNMVNCPSCERRMLHSELDEHNSKECPERPVVCEKCQIDFPAKEQDAHDCVKALLEVRNNMVETIKNERELSRSLLELLNLDEERAPKSHLREGTRGCIDSSRGVEERVREHPPGDFFDNYIMRIDISEASSVSSSSTRMFRRCICCFRRY